jgi:hypothetical protein
MIEARAENGFPNPGGLGQDRKSVGGGGGQSSRNRKRRGPGPNQERILGKGVGGEVPGVK